MNSEICKKCGNQFYLMQNIVLDDDSHVAGLHFCGVCRDKNGKAILECDFPLCMSELIEKEVTNRTIRYCYDLSFFSEIKSDKKCPYYMEHQMNEWNENEPGNMQKMR